MPNNINNCDCGDAHPGILWPWGLGHGGIALPYVERCDMCQRYPDDDAAADALVIALTRVGLDPLRGDHTARGEGTHMGVPGLYRVGLFVFPSPVAVHSDPAAWGTYVDSARSSLALVNNAPTGPLAEPSPDPNWMND